MTNFDSKTRFGKYNKFYYEVLNKKIQFENILVVYGSPESNEGEKSPTWVKCLIRKKSNIEVLMIIYGLMGSYYWLVLMGSCEKFRNFIFFIVFGLK